MAKRRKTRTHNVKADTAKKASDGTPKSFVIHAGEVGSSVKALSKDLRRVLEPNTATRLKERKSNKIKDFIAMSGPLGVSHMLVLAQSSANTNAAEDDKEDPTSNVNLRITRLPRGPTLGFKILRYALVRDVLAATRRPRSPGKEFATEPILILNNFSASNNTNDARQLTLLQTMFQNLFPPIKVHSMPLSSARRVVLLSYNPTTRTVDFRHYLITVRPVGVSRSVRKIIDGTATGGRKRASSVYSAAASDVSSQASFAALRAKGLPDLRSAQDISDYVLNHGDMGFLSSASEAESDASGGEEEGQDSRQVELAGAYVGRANKRLASSSSGGEKRAVRLTELGPRMELGLVKIEDGIGDGKGEVLFHEFIHKTPKEAADIARKAKEREKLAKKRREQQEANVKRKQAEKDAKKQDKAAKIAAEERDGENGEEAEEESDEEEFDEFEYEDMYGEDGQLKTNGQGAEKPDEEDDNDEELFEEPEEEEDESDFTPVLLDEKGDDIIDSSESEAEEQVSKKAKVAPKFSMRVTGKSGRGRR